MVKTSIAVSAFAVAGTALTVVGGLVLGGGSSSAEATPGSTTGGVTAPDRPATLSRASARQAASTIDAKSTLLSLAAGTSSAVTGTEDLTPDVEMATGTAGDYQAMAAAMISSYGWDDTQFGCLVNLWNKESNWRVNAGNSYGAYGIPQALPGYKMAAVGSDWQTNPETQIKWGLGYIHDRYGSPCGAWAHSESSNWY